MFLDSTQVGCADDLTLLAEVSQPSDRVSGVTSLNLRIGEYL